MTKNKMEKLTPLVETKFISLYDATYKNKNDEERHWMIVSRKDYKTLNDIYFNNEKEKIDAVVIASLHKESKKLVLIKQFRMPINDYIYELPAGLVDPNEDMKTTLKRELKEETGLDLLEINEVNSKNQVYLSPGMTDESVAFVYCTCEGNVTDEYLEDDEDIEPVLVSQDEAKRILQSNAKIDIKAFIMLQNFVNLGENMFV
ncbi:NUDIX hydrolase [Tepidibacter formicigenes]|jgi:ADP-ribose pyrophosphatase|uniref:ADP-ribose pyrophosphatase n=1 Tax=Tepidibacter formicigenes DSM 15518 TaxID=1123349 RepID=A0A1M6JEP1_9FIRM|nr:NUDIX hydrolase [Tepidibacter formicigenes]SHJ45072.1 ADP-ribose pyrophosphatase [Tepidibacter formicigenes DSM 15518]